MDMGAAGPVSKAWLAGRMVLWPLPWGNSHLSRGQTPPHSMNPPQPDTGQVSRLDPAPPGILRGGINMAAHKGKKGQAQPEFFQPRTWNKSGTSDGGGAVDPMAELLRGQKGILESMASFKTQMGNMEVTVVRLDSNLRGMETRMGQTENWLSQLEAAAHSDGQTLKEVVAIVAHHSGFVPTAANLIMELENRVEFLENQHRARVVRIVGMPADLEGVTLADATKLMIETVMAADASGHRVEVTRVARLPSSKPTHGGAKRGGTVLLTLTERDQRDILLRRVISLKAVHCDAQRMFLFPDVAPRMQERRMRFVELRRELALMGVTSSVWHPVRLPVVRDGKVSIFIKVDAAENFVDSVKKNLPSAPGAPAPAGDTM